tara:strand:+ start:212 stop:496 length:285 start_codon:yes stop_codon:yes gene_type:complete
MKGRSIDFLKLDLTLTGRFIIKSSEVYMYKYKVEKMNCMSCFRNIDDAVKDVDESAKLNVNIDEKTVSVESTLTSEQIKKLIDEAGYPAVSLES